MAVYRLVNMDGIALDVEAKVSDCDGDPFQSPLSLSVSFPLNPSQKLKLGMGLYKYTESDLVAIGRFYCEHFSSRTLVKPSSFLPWMHFVTPNNFHQHADAFPSFGRALSVSADQQCGFMDFLADTIRKVPHRVDLSVLHELATREVVSNDFIDRYFRTEKKLHACVLCWNESDFLQYAQFGRAMSSVKYTSVSNLLVGVYSENSPNLTRTDAVRYLYKCMGWRFQKKGV